LLASPENNISVVGDDDQSIYKFRGASISNILKFKEDYKQASEITLTENYRSTQAILDLSYKFIQQNNPERLEAKLKISKKLISDKKLDGEIQVMHARTVYEEACLVVDKLIELKEKENLSLNDFAILVRANDHAEPFLLELAKRGLPYIFVANRGLYRKPFILDILAYLRLLDNYHESENLFRVFNMSKFKIADEELINYSQWAKRKTVSLYEIIKDQYKNSKIKELLDLLNKHTQLARNLPISELMVRVLQDLGLIKDLVEDSIENSENRSVLEQFYRKVQSYEKDNEDKSLKGFLNQIGLEMEAGDQGELAFNPDLGPDAIRVMTVHSSKGLEFACVFVVNMVEQRFPSRDRKEQIEIPQSLVKEILPEGDVHLMEERRLFYVAATRAKQFLYFTWANDYGGSTHKKPSRFLVEIGLEQKPFKATPVGQVFFTSQPSLPKLKPKLRVPETFSFSGINCFLNCPLEFKYRYIYQLPLPGAAQLSFGDTIHKTLEKYLKQFIQLNNRQQADLFGKKKSDLELPAKELLQKYYAECWVDDWYQDKIQKRDYQKLGLKMLEAFFDKLAGDPKPIKFLEKRFRLKLGDYKFTGKIDRADENPDGTIEIIDYKTGAVKEKLSPEDKTQLLIYQWAAEEEFKEKVKSLRYWYLANLRDSTEFLGSKKDIEDVKEKMLDAIKQIVAAVETNSFAELDRKKSHECKFRHLEA
jgi:DNA helicase-2/ATP-dependent DNA helicase PcrA